MTNSRLRLGQLLVDARLITAEALTDVLAAQSGDGRRLGTLLVERGHISEVQLTQILSHQLSVPWVTLLKIEFSRQLLNLVPRELAERYCLLPIYVRRVRHQGDTLYIAMDDPTNEEALRACAAYAGLAVRPMIAPPSDIRSAIRAYYGAAAAITEPPPATANPAAESTAGPASGPVAEPSASTTAAPPASPEPRAAETSVSPRPVRQRVATLRSALHDELGPAAKVRTAAAASPETAAPERGPARPRKASPEADPVIQVSEIGGGERPTPAPDSRPVPIPSPRGQTPRMISLTLLDGTTITLPARPTKQATAEPLTAVMAARTVEPAADPASNLTARDLVAALRAVADGTDTSAILGDDVRWEAMFGALLSLLLKKHLIADWEFVEELNKIQKR